MVKYLCHNCDDLSLKNISSVIDHVWAKHKIEVAKEWHPLIRAEDARLPPKKTGSQRVTGFRCEDCNVSLTGAPSFLTHLDRMHGIHIWYEKGLTRKRIFFDGILNASSARDELGQQKFIPLSKRPYEPRKSDSG